LIDPATNVPVWSEIYDGDLVDVFGFQADIATRISMALEAEILPSERENIERIPTDSHEAHALYLRAIAELGGATGLLVSGETSNEFHRYLDEAIEADPNFALAYATKSRHYAYSFARDRRISEEITITEIENLARENAEHALMLDPDLGLAHAAEAVIHRFNRRWAESRASYELALQSSPNDFDLLFDFMYFNFTVGRVAEGVALGKRIAANYPSADGYDSLGVAMFWSGDYDAAANFWRKATGLSPANPLSHRSLGSVEAIRGNRTRAIEELRLSERLGGTDGRITELATLIYFHGRVGNGEDADRLFSLLQDRASEFHVGAGIWTMAYLGVGDRQQALEWLNVAAESPAPDNGFLSLYMIANNYYADPILEQSEWVEVRRRLGFRE